MKQGWPICRFVLPSATSASASASRWVRPSKAADDGAVGDTGVSTGSSQEDCCRKGKDR
jgi:hypothetical protein